MTVEFFQGPPKSTGERPIDLVRTPPTGVLSGIIITDDTWGLFVHFWGGHTVPCTGATCPACAKMVGKKYRQYTAIWNPTSKQSALLEVTEGPGTMLTQLHGQRGGLRGVKIVASRKNGKPNGKVMISLEDVPLTRYVLPPEIDIIAKLKLIWRITETREGQESVPYAEAVERVENLEDSKNGTTRKRAAALAGVELPRGPRTPHDIHEREGSAGDLSASQPLKATKPSAKSAEERLARGRATLAKLAEGETKSVVDART